MLKEVNKGRQANNLPELVVSLRYCLDCQKPFESPTYRTCVECRKKREGMT